VAVADWGAAELPTVATNAYWCICATGYEVCMGLGRIVALYHCASALHQIH
jgi:hypothetical protein